MAAEQYDPRIVPRGPESRGTDAPDGEPSLGELLRRLTSDTGELVRQEVQLAKTEMRQVGSHLAQDGAKIGAALVLALAGVLALTAFLVVLLGDLFDNYWLAALLVGVVFVAVGGLLAKNAVDDVKQRGVKPEQTIDSLREDAAWAKREVRAVKRELTT